MYVYRAEYRSADQKEAERIGRKMVCVELSEHVNGAMDETAKDRSGTDAAH
jgi:hypothetical protein